MFSSSEETPSQETAPEGNAPLRFGTSNSSRFLVLSVAAIGLVTIGAEWISDVNGKLAEGSEIATDAVAVGLLVYALFAVFQRSVVVGAEEIRKVRPLWWDKSVRISAIRQVHVPTTESGLWLYTDPDRNPALKIGAGLEDPDRLKELVVQSVPPEAKITGHRQEERMS